MHVRTILQNKAAAAPDEEEFLDEKTNLDELSGDDEDEGTFRLGQADEVRLINQAIVERELSLALLEQLCPKITCTAKHLLCLWVRTIVGTAGVPRLQLARPEGRCAEQVWRRPLLHARRHPSRRRAALTQLHHGYCSIDVPLCIAAK